MKWFHQISIYSLLICIGGYCYAQKPSSFKRDSLYVERIERPDDYYYKDRLYINYNGKKQLIYEKDILDDSSINYIGSQEVNGKRIFDCYGIYDNVADGNNFLFFDYASRTIYLTDACLFSSFRPLLNTVDFRTKRVMTKSEYLIPDIAVIDTLDATHKREFIHVNARIIKASFSILMKIGSKP